MNTKIDDGGPAFPVSMGSDREGPNAWQLPGMTLRDYFAAKAMQGMMAGNWNTNYDAWADHAYQMADAMIKAREV